MLDLAIILFIIMESANVLILYFKPEFKYGNGVAVFKQWEKSKANEDEHLFAKYMTSWVAGSKLIFIALLIVIVMYGNEEIKVFSVIAILISIASYFFRLRGIVTKLDQRGMIQPKGYSTTLTMMICGFLVMFALALGAHYVI